VSARPASGSVLRSGGQLRFKLLFAAMIACVLVGSCAAGQSPARRRAKRAQSVQQEQPAPSPAPVAPLSPEQMPASPPQVSFNGGILTIVANNSTLGDILRAVRRQTGATVDTPGNATERVVGMFGPGPARDVLASLLNGSHFNYVLLGSATNPSALERVMLMSKSGGEPVQQANAAGPQNFAPATAVPQPAENADFSNDDSADMTQDSTDTADDQAAQPEEQPQQQPQPAPVGPAGAVRTPEQLLQELQQRQQMIQQQQQQGTPQSFPPAPLGVPQPPQPQP